MPCVRQRRRLTHLPTDRALTHSAVYGRPLTVQVILRRWPTLVAIGFVVWTALDLSEGVDLAPVVAAAAIVYLGAAALRRPSAAWPGFLAALLIVVVAEELGSADAATWVLLGLAVPLLAYGLLSGATRGNDGLRQAIAMVGFGAAVAIALGASNAVGAYLVAAALLAHAAWDVYHYRVNRVVVRSLAEFCFVLDTLLAVAIVIVTV
jgi:hypothetical protein